MANSKKRTPKTRKPKETLRERNLKAAEAKSRPRRIRRAATSAAKPVGKVSQALKTEFHIFPQSENSGFFTKSRKATPSYFVKSVSELKNVTWPERKETWKLVFAVFVFALMMGGFIAVLDYGLEKLFRNIIL